jgi:hypothetical protein
MNRYNKINEAVGELYAQYSDILVNKLMKENKNNYWNLLSAYLDLNLTIYFSKELSDYLSGKSLVPHNRAISLHLSIHYIPSAVFLWK